ncbi:hypothetical protein KC337_g15 [Hortaea werneckii]|nr:hypothetical protein KC337_g15 [Hortaea werneckii]
MHQPANPVTNATYAIDSTWARWNGAHGLAALAIQKARRSACCYDFHNIVMNAPSLAMPIHSQSQWLYAYISSYSPSSSSGGGGGAFFFTSVWRSRGHVEDVIFVAGEANDEGINGFEQIGQLCSAFKLFFGTRSSCSMNSSDTPCTSVGGCSALCIRLSTKVSSNSLWLCSDDAPLPPRIISKAFARFLKAAEMSRGRELKRRCSGLDGVVTSSVPL